MFDFLSSFLLDFWWWTMGSYFCRTSHILSITPPKKMFVGAGRDPRIFFRVKQGSHFHHDARRL